MSRPLVRFAFVCSGLLALACGRQDAPPEAAASVPPTPPTDFPIPPPPRAPPPDAGLESAMADHFGAIREIQLGIIHGLLDHAKERAIWLAGHLEAPGYEDRTAELAAVHAEATTLAASNELGSAARQAARLGGACGACHLAARATTTFVYDELPATTSTLAERMRRHHWAAERMWEGIVGPSTEQWRLGAEALVRAPLISDPRLAAMPRASEVKALAARVRRLARAAVASTDAEQRVGTYGELLATCSSCHVIAWPIVRAK